VGETRGKGSWQQTTTSTTLNTFREIDSFATLTKSLKL
jgi:hypothetical protein